MRLIRPDVLTALLLQCCNGMAISLSGPVLSENFADPSIIKIDNTYYAFATHQYRNNSHLNIPMASSKSFQSGWHAIEGDALPDAGDWAESPAYVVTPDINQLSDGSFIMYYAAIPKGLPYQEHCVGAATAAKVTGPFKPQQTPLLCPRTGNGDGTADPNGFTYKNELYIVFKNASGHDMDRTSYIDIEKVESNGYTPNSAWTEILHSIPADSNDTEAPALVENPTGGFVLFYTVGKFQSTNLRIEYATSDGLLGPYQRQGVLLETATYGGVHITAPVGPDVVNGNASEIVFEAYKKGDFTVRQMHTAILKYNGTKVTLA